MCIGLYHRLFHDMCKPVKSKFGHVANGSVSCVLCHGLPVARTASCLIRAIHCAVTSSSLPLPFVCRKPSRSSMRNFLERAIKSGAVRTRNKKRNELWRRPRLQLWKKQSPRLLPTPKSVARVLAKRSDDCRLELPVIIWMSARTRKNPCAVIQSQPECYDTVYLYHVYSCVPYRILFLVYSNAEHFFYY